MIAILLPAINILLPILGHNRDSTALIHLYLVLQLRGVREVGALEIISLRGLAGTFLRDNLERTQRARFGALLGRRLAAGRRNIEP